MENIQQLLAYDAFHHDLPRLIFNLAQCIPMEAKHYLPVMKKLRPYVSHIRKDQHLLDILRKQAKMEVPNALLFAIAWADLTTDEGRLSCVRDRFAQY